MAFSSFSSIGSLIKQSSVSVAVSSATYATFVAGNSSLVSSKPPWAAYYATDFNTSTHQLIDATGNGRHATASTGVSKTSATGNGTTINTPYIYGSTTATLTFPTGSIPTNFTICAITRYTGGANQRILQATGLNWFHGHWQGKSACYYSQWMTNEFASNTDTNWKLTCGKNSGATPNNILVNNSGIGTSSGGYGGTVLTINAGQSGEVSNWALAQVIIWDQVLTNTELATVSSFMYNSLTVG